MHRVQAKGILSANNGMNVYRGCTHGCIYCDSRSKCYDMPHDFEDIEVKENAPELLKDALKRKRNKCVIFTGAMSDPYMPIEKEFCIMRRCLEIIEKYEFGVSVLTKSNLILRDLDILKRINKKTKAVVCMTLTTFDERLCRIIEPNVCTTKERFEALKIFAENGIPTVVWLCPILPFINDMIANLDGIMDYCIKANVKGIINFSFGTTARQGSREYFYKMLDKHFKGIKEKYIKKYGNLYEITSKNNPILYSRFKEICKANNIMCNNKNIFEYLGKYETPYEQLSLFDVITQTHKI